MHKGFLIFGILFGGLAVALGAFGTHGLQNLNVNEKNIYIFQIAMQYQMYHALALLAVAIIFERIPTPLIKWAGNFFVIGIILFSGSLYILTLIKILGKDNLTGIVIVTPIGGISFIVGWILFLIGAIRYKKP